MARGIAGRGILLALIAGIAAACAGDSGVVPTLAPTLRAAVQPSATPVVGTPLPPTWTPRPTLTPLPPVTPAQPTYPTQTPRRAPSPSPATTIAGASGHGLPVDLARLTPQNAARVREVAHINQSAQEVALSPDGTLLALATRYDRVFIYSTDRLDSPLRRLGSGWYWSMTVAFSPDGSMLVAGYDDGALRIWDPKTGAVLRVIAAHRNNVLDVTFSPDGQELASGGYDNLVRTWDVATGTQLRELDGHRGDVYALAYRPPDGALLVSGGENGELHVWDVAEGVERAALGGHDWEARALAFSPDGATLASGGYDGAIRLWDARTLGSDEPQAILGDDYSPSVLALAYSPDGELLAAALSDDMLHLWRTDTYAEVAAIDARLSWPTSLAFSPDGTFLVLAGMDDRVSLWGVPGAE
jgi:WD40 repeat protein